MDESRISFKEAKRLSLKQWKKTQRVILELEANAKPSGFCTRWNDGQNPNDCKYNCEARFLCEGGHGTYEAVAYHIEPLRNAIAKMIENLESLRPPKEAKTQ